MPIRILSSKAVPKSTPLPVQSAADPDDDLSSISADVEDGEDLDLENYVADELDAEDEDDDPDEVEAGNHSLKVHDLAEKYLGECDMVNRIQSGEAYIEVKPTRSPALNNSKAFGNELKKLGLNTVWDGDNKSFKVTSANAVEADLDDAVEDPGTTLYDFLVSYFGLVPEPTDEQIHQLALAIGMEPEELEAEIYRIMSIMFNDDAGDEADEFSAAITSELDEPTDTSQEELEELTGSSDEDDGEELDLEADVEPYSPAEGEPDGAPDQAVVEIKKPTAPL